MQLPDVNVLLYAFRTASPQHALYRRWLEDLINGDSRYALSELVLSAVIRIATNAHVFHPPERLAAAFEFVDYLKSQPHCLVISPGARHWQIFSQLCLTNKITGPKVSDAYLAALAIEHGCEMVTNDRDFARFPGLRWRHPLD